MEQQIFITIAQAASLFGVSGQTIRRLCWDGQLRHVTMPSPSGKGGRQLINKKELLALFESYSTGPIRTKQSDDQEQTQVQQPQAVRRGRGRPRKNGAGAPAL